MHRICLPYRQEALDALAAETIDGRLPPSCAEAALLRKPEKLVLACRISFWQL